MSDNQIDTYGAIKRDQARLQNIINNQAAEIDALRKILARVREVGDYLAMVADDPDSTRHSFQSAIQAWNGVNGRVK